MKKTNKRIYMYSKYMGWNFSRRIYADADGNEFVNMRGWTPLEWVCNRADYYATDYE